MSHECTLSFLDVMRVIVDGDKVKRDNPNCVLLEFRDDRLYLEGTHQVWLPLLEDYLETKYRILNPAPKLDAVPILDRVRFNRLKYIDCGLGSVDTLTEAVEVLTEALENIRHLHYDSDKMYQDFSNEALEKVWGSEKGDGDEN